MESCGVVQIMKQKKQSYLEYLMESQMAGADIEEWEAEYCFYPDRKFRFDFAWPSRKIALEVEGGTWSSGRHTTGKGFEGDCEKYNSAVVLGWKVIRATSNHVYSGAALVWVQSLLRK